MSPSVVAVRRLLVALVVGAVSLSTSIRVQADEEKPSRDAKPSQTRVSLSAVTAYGSFVTLPVMRAGVGVEGRMRIFSGHAFLMLGRTPNGLGAHRIEVGANLTTPTDWLGGWFRASAGPHVGYAMLVRTTEQNAIVNALFGDIASFAIGAHAAVELSVPVSHQMRVFLAARAMGEIYARRNGWELGPQLGVQF